MKRPARRRLAALLLLACLLPAAALAARLFDVFRPAATAEPPARVAAGPAFEPAEPLPPLADLAVTRERPLFLSTRRYPPAGSGLDGPAGLVLGKYEVKGVVVLPAARFVMLRPAAGGAVLRLAVGDLLEGHRIVAVEPGAVTLEGPEGRRTYEVGGAK